MLSHEEKSNPAVDADSVEAGIAKAVRESFKLRPMRAVTRREIDRRTEAAYEARRSLVQDAGYAPLLAVRALTVVLVEYIDREEAAKLSLIATPLKTKMMPHNMGSRLEAERSLSALAAKHGMIDSEVSHER